MSRLIREFLKGHAFLLAILAPLMMLVEVFMDLMQPKLLSDIIDIGIANNDLDYVMAVGLRMILVAFIGFLGGASCSVLASIAAVDMGGKLRQGLFDKIQSLSFLEIDHFRPSTLITRMTNDISQVQNMFAMLLRGAVRSPMLCVGGMVMAVLSGPRLSVVFIIAVPMILLATVVIIRKSLPLFIGVQEMLDRLNLTMRESILGIRVIKALTIEAHQHGRFSRVNGALREASIKAQDMNMLLWPITTLVMNMSIVGVLWFGGGMVMAGSLEIGKIMAFTNYLIQIMASLIMVVNMVMNFTRAEASALRIREVLDAAPSVQSPDQADAMAGYDVEFRNVSFQYNAHSEPVLTNISFAIREGEKVAVIGSTGSGKSSLVQLIPRLYDASMGQVLIGGKDVRSLETESLRNRIGVVLQESILFSGTIEENLRFGDRAADEKRLEGALRDAQIYDFVMEKQERGKSRVEQRGKNFSGGQKQRLSIARTLVGNPEILILDDATSALDVATEARLLERIRENMEKSTVIMIAQRVSAAMGCDKIIVMDNGRIAAIGDHRQLLQQCDIYKNIAISQLGEEVLMHG